MKRLFVSLFLLSIATTLVHAQRQTSQETLIRNATVITVTRGTLENTDVLLRNGKIAGVGKNLNASANARIIDGTGKFVLPGIIDAHSHSMLDTINEGTCITVKALRVRLYVICVQANPSISCNCEGCFRRATSVRRRNVSF